MIMRKMEINVQHKNELPSLHHITRAVFDDWQEGKLAMQDEMDFLEHIGSCTFCAGQFGSWMEEKDAHAKAALFVEPPGYLKEEILDRIKQVDVQAAVKIKETSRQMQLFIYGLKVGFAVIASIFLLTVTANVQNMDLRQFGDRRIEQMQGERGRPAERDRQDESVTSVLRRGSSQVTNVLNDMSRGWFQFGT